MLFDHVHEFQNALQSLTLPIRTFALFQHHAPGIALVHFHELGQFGLATRISNAGPEGDEACVAGRGLETVGLQ